MQKSHPEIPAQISEWKGQDILAFQIELREKQNENISEKWFYTHMKSGIDKLPRIDMLNLLSRYAGYRSWRDFRFRYGRSVENVEIRRDRSNRLFIIVPALVVAVLLVFYLAISTIYNQEYSFHFVDSESGDPLGGNIINISVLVEGESPHYYTADETGCFVIEYSHRFLSFVVETSGYRPDTIIRQLNKFNREEIIRLRPE
jgi:hypothetical protein